MKRIILTFVFIIIFVFQLISQTYAEKLEDVVTGYKYNTYSKQEIDDSLYVVHSYYKNDFNIYGDKNYLDVTSNNGIGFYVGGNMLVVSTDSFGYNGPYGYYIVCKNQIENGILSEKCLGEAQLKFYDKELGLAALEIEGLNGKSLSSNENKDFYEENGFIAYGVNKDSFTEIKDSINNFKQNIGCYIMSGEKQLLCDYDNYYYVPLFYNNSFVGFVNNKKVIHRDEILEFLENKGKNLFNLSDDDINEFNKFVPNLIKEIESEEFNIRLEKDFVDFSVVKDSLYEVTYKIDNYDELEQDIEGIYIMYDVVKSKNENGLYDYVDFSLLQESENSFSGDLYNLEKIEGGEFVININDFKNKFSDIFVDGYDGNIYLVRFELFVKIGDEYYSNKFMEFEKFDFTKEGKISKVINIIQNNNYSYFSNLHKKIIKIRNEIGDENYNKLIDNKVFNDKVYKLISRAVESINSEEDLNNLEEKLFLYIKRYCIYDDEFSMENEVNFLLDEFIQSLDSYKTTNTRIYIN